jgi:ABC-type transport system involved in multi-copper enzyme maturation permease subunit
MSGWRLGPVFFFECVTAARRWQTYAGRAAFLSILLVSLIVVWLAKVAPTPGPVTLSMLADVGESFFYALVGTQLGLVLLAAPAYTAGAVCLDKARGTLAHILVTDLSAREIILGKLCSRLMPILGLVVVVLPLLALAALLGGIDPGALFGGFLVTLGVAGAGCSLALALSVWGNRPYEVLLITYLVWAVWLLAWPAWHLLPGGWGLGAAPAWLEKSNPFGLAFAPYLHAGVTGAEDYFIFLCACAGLAALLTALAAATLRRAATREPRPRGRRRGRMLGWWLPRIGPSLDFNPVLWREWNGRRPSRWVRAAWVIYVVLSLGASVTVLVTRAPGPSGEMAPLVNAFQYSIGLLLVSVTSVTALFEERVRGSLDALLTTPLPTPTIVRGKWWGAYRSALLVMLIPLGLVLGCALVRPPTGFGRPERYPGEEGLLLALFVGLMLAYGAAVTSLGLALATWVKRFGVAVGLSVAVYVLVTGGSILLILGVRSYGPGWRGFAYVSPWYGAGVLTATIGEGIGPGEKFAWMIVWAMVYALAAVSLLVATQQTFERCMGRISGGGGPRPRYHVRRR